MAITVLCDECGHDFVTDDALAGKETPCPACGEMCRVPTLAQVALRHEIADYTRRGEGASETRVVEEDTPTTEIAYGADGRPLAPENPVDDEPPPPEPMPSPSLEPEEEESVTSPEKPEGQRIPEDIPEESEAFEFDAARTPKPAEEDDKPLELDHPAASPTPTSEEEQGSAPYEIERPAPAEQPPAAEPPRRRIPSPPWGRELTVRILRVGLLLVLALVLVECLENSWSLVSGNEPMALGNVFREPKGVVESGNALGVGGRLLLLAFFATLAVRLIIKTKLIENEYTGDAGKSRGLPGLLFHSTAIVVLGGLVAWLAARSDAPGRAVEDELALLSAIYLLLTATWLLAALFASRIRRGALVAWVINDVIFGVALIFLLTRDVFGDAARNLFGLPYGVGQALVMLGLLNSTFAFAASGRFSFGARTTLRTTLFILLGLIVVGIAGLNFWR